MLKYSLLFSLGLFVGCLGSPAPQLNFTSTANVVSISDTLTMVFVGDIMCHQPQVRSALKSGQFDFDPWFQYVKPIIQNADLAFGNLETTLSQTGPFSGYPRFKSPDTLASALLRSGFDVMVTANNHSNDTRTIGLLHTIKSLKELGIYQTGTFISDLARENYYPLLLKKNDFKIALLNYTYDTNGIPTPEGVFVNLIDTVQIKQDIIDAKKMGPDLLLAFMHWGPQYRPKPDRDQQKMASWLVRSGVDHIIGSHPHVVQPIEIINFENKQHLVAYSLGNFISNQRKKNTDGGIILELKFVRGGNQTRIIDYQYIPVWRYIKMSEGLAEYQILPIKQFENDTTYFHNLGAFREMGKYAKHIRKHLTGMEEKMAIP